MEDIDTRRKKQFRHLINIFQNIESCVLISWEDKREGLSMEVVGRMCQTTGLTDLGYEVIGALISQSDKIQLIGSPGAYELVPRAIDVAAAEGEAS